MSRYQFEDVDDLGEILFSDDPALRLQCVLMGLQTTDGTILLDPAQTRHMPTALFEFRQAVGVGDFGYVVPDRASTEGIPEEPQIEGAILFGMRRLPPDFADLRLPYRPEPEDDGGCLDEICFCMRRRLAGHVDLVSIPGWELHEIPDDQPKLAERLGYTYSRLELRTPLGEIYSRTWVAHDPEWAAAALRYGYVVCLCGVTLGVRAPYGMSDAQHTPRMRREALRLGCAVGLTIGGLVAYVDHR